MKKKLLCIFFACGILNGYSQVITFNPAITATAYTFFTNDEEHLTVLQTIEQLCGPSYYVPALHFSTTPVTINSYSFAPGFYYTVQINGSATASGDLSNPAVPIYFAVTLGAPQSATAIAAALQPFPNPFPIMTYAGSITVNGPLISPRPTSTTDMMGNFLTGIVGIGSFTNSAVVGSSTITPQFSSTATTNTFNIEAYPVLGDQPGLNTSNGCGGNQNNIVVPTNTTITINSITLTKTPIQVASINGGTDIFFSSSHTGGGGTITAAPGATVTVQVYANGAPGGNYTAACNLSGVSFSTGSGSLQVTNGSVTATFIMPASGSVTWNGNFSESSTFGSGGISVH